MMKIKNLWPGFIAVVLLATSCGTTAHIEKDDDADFTRYKTFAWAGTENGKSQNDLMDNNIRTAVQAELEKAGWRVTKQKPDVLIDYDVLVEKTTRQQNDPVYSRSYTRLFYNRYTGRVTPVYFPSQFVGYDRTEQTIREGTVTITMLDARTDKMVWQGWTTSEVNSQRLTGKEIQQSVRSIFRKFDVAGK